MKIVLPLFLAAMLFIFMLVMTSRAMNDAAFWRDAFFKLNSVCVEREARDIELLKWIYEKIKASKREPEKADELRNEPGPQNITPLLEIPFDTIVTTNSFDNSVWTNRIPRGLGYGIELCNRRSE